MHNDGFGSTDPALDLRYGNIGIAVSLERLQAPSLAPAPLASFSQVLIHVLSKVSEKCELFMKWSRHLIAAHTGQVIALAELDKSENILGFINGSHRQPALTCYYLLSAE